MSLTLISPQAARDLLDQGAMLIDIRAADEYAREHIVQARHIPMEQITNGPLALENTAPIIFHCRSGNRTQMNAKTLAACAPGNSYVIEGGLDAWKKVGLPVEADPSKPLELQRQVQIVAGSLIVAGVILGAVVSPWFHLLSGFVGTGLMFAGLSGFCGLAHVLMCMPWNRKAL